jgi:beta-N-acetylhexosaminidase
LGFGGLSFTDDLEMGAIAKHWPVGEAAALAVAAGHDVLLICEHLDNVEKTLARLSNRSDLEEQRQAARQRLFHVKRRLVAAKGGSVSFP